MEWVSQYCLNDLWIKNSTRCFEVVWNKKGRVFTWKELKQLFIMKDGNNPKSKYRGVQHTMTLSALRIRGFQICRFNQPRIKDV